MITRVPALERSIIGGRLVLDPSSRATPVALRGSAAAIWAALTVPADIEGLLISLSRTFGQPVDELRNDVVTTLDDLAARGLITR
jgi:hypothetical protein